MQIRLTFSFVDLKKFLFYKNKKRNLIEVINMNMYKVSEKTIDKFEKLYLESKSVTQTKLAEQFSIEREKFSETTSKLAFAKLSKEFTKDKLNFYTDGYYYPFRNKLIETFATFISLPSNLTYLLNTVAYYTYDDVDVTPCPYKLLIGTERGSRVKEVTSDETTREIFFNKKSINYTNISTRYDGKSQTFTLKFTYKPLNIKVEAPIVLRTRAKGGWSGKALYITTSGFKKK